jgi:hypothetical protein
LIRVTLRGFSPPPDSSASFFGGPIRFSSTPSEDFVVFTFGGRNSMPSGNVSPMHLMGIRRAVHDGTKSSTVLSETVCVSIVGSRPSAGLNPVWATSTRVPRFASRISAGSTMFGAFSPALSNSMSLIVQTPF